MHYHIEESALIAKGGHRSCYQHPENNALCIKVLHEPWQTIERRLKDPLRAIRRRRNYDENLSEWIELKKLESKLGEDHSRHFPRVYDLVETNLGDGLVADLIRDFDGTLSHTLKSYLWEHCEVTPECAAAIDEFWAFLKERRLIVRDPFPHNLMVQRVDETGRLRILQIDGFGSSDFLPFSKMITSLRNKKLDGRRKRMQRQVDKHLKEISKGNALKGKGAAFQ
ncbi:MAG: YrbL family protein [Opitutaceae bacterium]